MTLHICGIMATAIRIQAPIWGAWTLFFGHVIMGFF